MQSSCKNGFALAKDASQEGAREGTAEYQVSEDLKNWDLSSEIEITRTADF